MKKKYTDNNSSRMRMPMHAKTIFKLSVAAAATLGIACITIGAATSKDISTDIITDGTTEVTECTTIPICVRPVSTTQTTSLSAMAHTTTSTVTSTLCSTIITSMVVEVQPMNTAYVTVAPIDAETPSAVDSPQILEVDVVTDDTTTEALVTDEEYVMLCNLVGHEYGSDWVPVYEKAKVAAVAMNRLHNGYWGSTLYNVLTAPGQFPGFSSYGTGDYTYQVTSSVREAVDYYLAHPDEFDNWLYFDGGHYASDGSGPYNYFYY